MNILQYFIMFYFGQNILFLFIDLITDIKYIKEHGKELLKLKTFVNILKVILIGIPIIAYEYIKEK